MSNTRDDNGDPPQPATADVQPTPEKAARHLMRTAWKATLSTLDAATGHPYGSMVAVATLPDGAPILLLSGLALHTKNLSTDPRASLLFDGTESSPRALTGSRVTCVGDVRSITDPELANLARRRYLAKHPAASMFVDFSDFQFYELDVAWGHLVAGFGRIDRLTRDHLHTSTIDAAELIAAECDIVQHMNDHHADALRLMANYLGGASATEMKLAEPPIEQRWCMIGCDPEGLDLCCGDRAMRLDFPHRTISPSDVRKVLIEMVDQARAAQQC